MANSHRLLLVEDDEELREIISRRLVRRCFEVVGCSEPSQALDAAARQIFDAAILDGSLPQMNGLELLKRLRTAHARLPIIVLSGSIETNAPGLAIEHGAFAYLSKPCGLDELEAAIHGALANSANPSAGP